MSSRTSKVAPAMAVVLMAGLGTTAVAGPADASYEDGFCPGMTAPQNNNVGNLPPVARNDTASVVAGDLVPIRVLANDTDPNGDKLYVVSASVPGKGESCVGPTGIIEYASEHSTVNYTQRITYGLTDGDEYRTATVTVSVEGVKPVVAQLKQRLLLRKGGHKVKRRAIVAFRNDNRRAVAFFAGHPRKQRPAISRWIAPGQTLTFGTRLRRLQYIAGRTDSNGELTLVSVGLLNTVNGRQRTVTPEDFYRTTPDASRTVHRWLR